MGNINDSTNNIKSIRTDSLSRNCNLQHQNYLNYNSNNNFENFYQFIERCKYALFKSSFFKF